MDGDDMGTLKGGRGGTTHERRFTQGKTAAIRWSAADALWSDYPWQMHPLSMVVDAPLVRTIAPPHWKHLAYISLLRVGLMMDTIMP